MYAESGRILRCVLPYTACGVAFTLTSQSAEAFFPPVPTTPPRVIIVDVPPVPPVIVPPTVVPPVPPPPFVEVPPVVPPTVVPPTVVPPTTCNCPQNPNTVPEPASVTAGLIGLAAVAGYRRWKRS
jgi:hypothetical protein